MADESHFAATAYTMRECPISRRFSSRVSGGVAPQADPHKFDATANFTPLMHCSLWGHADTVRSSFPLNPISTCP
eukprot:6189811-Pleurochrysis_carterae.AAC.1